MGYRIGFDIGSTTIKAVVLDENKYLILINPVILKTSGKTYQTEEGCLSLQGVRKTQRYESIKVSYLDQDFKKKIKTFKGYTAQIIQHELDHFEGKSYKKSAIAVFFNDIFLQQVD